MTENLLSNINEWLESTILILLLVVAFFIVLFRRGIVQKS